MTNLDTKTQNNTSGNIALDNLHQPVLLGPILDIFQQEVLSTVKSASVFDGTFGGGSYSQALLNLSSLISPSDSKNNLEIKLWSTDLDPAAKILALNFTSTNFKFVASNFADQIQEFKDDFLDLAVLDLGFSSNQLELGQLGFSYLQTDQLFDLRFNPEEGTPAYKYICGQTVDKLGRTIFQYSGETMARRIAESLITTCKSGKFTNQDIAEAILQVIPAKLKHKKYSIYSRIWQALRIAVNDEFGALETFLACCPGKIKVGGLIAIVCFHSLEDKMVTKKFRDLAKPEEIDEYGNKQISWKLLTAHPITASPEELDKNNRARSATLRIIKRLL